MLRTVLSRDCLELCVERPARPGLRWEVTSGRRLLLRQDTGVVVLARVETDRSGVHVARTDRYRSPIPPIRVTQARRLPPPGSTPEPSLSWAHWFAGHLSDNPLGPLHNGRWLLRTPESLPPYTFRGDLMSEHPYAYLSWTRGWNGVLPLRPLPEVDAARVKAFRRQVREQVLPPVLLWDASCLDGYVLLDGHARLAAALAENVTPPALLLGRGDTDDSRSALLDLIAAEHRSVLADIARTKGEDHPAYRTFAERAQRQIADLCVTEPMRFTRTRAWTMPGGAPAWDRLAADLH
ncbi:hypothetical protein KO481_33155 [Nocardia sp. NEAU-G5]|uniref:ParB/Sulfiredoxin domain-containing protein n=1 Tax=Nocardia albiluteola TaxID=2842303 RepID=A0ABS6BAA3_9NOCA|nr:hypothetical protein [Nocardia albiluteola]MBU3066356.1 hypothetical protein [Nocardia albiluteola]